MNYRIIGFSFPKDSKTHSYQIEVALGTYNDEDSFRKKVILSSVAKINKLITEVPDFGENYTWQVVYSGKNKYMRKSPLYHFSTIINARVVTTKYRLNILHPAEEHKNDYVAVENGGVIYDMNGKPVWCLPDSYGRPDKISDLKFTSQGTITFMIDQTGYEIDYDGNKLWQTPAHDGVSGDVGADYYHHEFTRLQNGHYVILGTEFIWYKRITTKDSDYVITIVDTNNHNKNNGGFGVKNRGRYGIIVEFDEAGHVVWSWKSSNYLQTSDYVNYWPADTSLRYEPHENAFYFDEEKKIIYLSYRQLSRIIAIDYPSGKVLNAYGEIFKPGIPPKGYNDLFCNQHSIRLSQDRNLYIFNNNVCKGPTAMPSIVMMRETSKKKENGFVEQLGLEKIWEYTCTAEDYTRGFPSGGIGFELPDRSMFICMGSDYAKLLIVNREKKILWSALPEKYDPVKQKWEAALKTYRANIISRQSLEHLINITMPK